MIKNINFEDDKILLELFSLQKAAYQVEAELIKFYDIPPLKESFEDLKECRETFLGYFEETTLAGALSYAVDGDELEICRMIVHPTHFRKGIAQRLLNVLEDHHEGIHVFKVSTGKDNTPAKRLYLKNNFKLIRNLEVAPGFFISNFEKRRFEVK